MGRGKKTWLPFRAITEQNAYLNKVFKKHNTQPINKQSSKKINEYLCSYHFQEVVIVYKENIEILSIEGFITKIDKSNQLLLINNVIIPLEDLISISDYKKCK